MKQLIDLAACGFGYLAVFVYAVEDIRRAEVRCENDYRVLEIDRPALRIGDASVIEHL